MDILQNTAIIVLGKINMLSRNKYIHTSENTLNVNINLGIKIPIGND